MAREQSNSLVGRAHELGVLKGLDGSLILRGPAGVGKSALLDALATDARANNARVLRAAGVQAETDFAYAGLHQLLHPLLGQASEMEPAHRATLTAVLGGIPERAPSVMALGVAVLDLLSVAGARTPLLLIVDDGQWFDVPSVRVCAFVARRLDDLPIRVVVAVRDTDPSGFDDAGFNELAVAPLSPEDAAELLDNRYPGLSADTRRQTLEYADGIPLALVELPGNGPGADPGTLSLPRRLEKVFADRIRALPDAERRELLLMALDGAGRQQAHGPHYIPEMTTAAQAAGLLLDAEPAFRHPLVASAVVQTASPNERRAAHAVLAGLYAADLERRAAHRAAAAVDPDPEIAGELERAARSAVRRGGATTAVQWLTRAAELHPRPKERARLLADAAYVAGQAGLLERAEILVAAADQAGGRVSSPDAVLTAAYIALYRHGDVAMHGVVAGVVRARHAELDDVMLTRLVNLLLALSLFAGDPAAWMITDEVTEKVQDRLPPTTLLCRDAWSDVVRRGAGLTDRLREAVTDFAEPWDLMRLGVAAFWVDTLADFRPYLRRTAERERDSGAASSLMTILQLVMFDDIAAGRWDEAVRVGEQGLALTEEHGYDLFGHQFRVFLGIVAAQRGDSARAAELQAVVDAWARPRRVGFLIQFAEEIGLLAALSSGDYETAWTYAIGITSPGTFPPYVQHSSRTLLDLVEAALHTGRDGIARTHVIAAKREGFAEVSPRLALLVAGAEAMTDPSQAAFAAAAELPGGLDFPFERARIRLAEGAWLRRQKMISEARVALNDAAETFERLGAHRWAERARRELGSGSHSGKPDHQQLTTQERLIAELAATGLSNKQIGAQLFLSPRTVGAHLYRIFPKLGITSRAALRDALDD
ncbi:DNA-binding CsgD family transcriptional regulator [Actinoplanes lutulentus]|uniref:Regulatory LuxR family protein n=1 Tax=Actinoplanes lutulentus TaxID=1287878 RepID=A0A327ZA15_9ACTN|nr:LuxR family transcriptional regulator [Actinoplanes lutulentus]MBB2947137.1 DNA-binding CsgD family transcriptional regulator [Actinoplanes lutulentus]RAK36413.1 regulatory LuxR family protein [Actinoplanes lutulentus]